jgi:hypothetical protein
MEEEGERLPRKLDPEAVTPDIHWKPTKKEDIQLCREIKRILAEENTGLGDFLRPLLELKRDESRLSRLRETQDEKDLSAQKKESQTAISPKIYVHS